MEITRADMRPAQPAPSEWFTGSVWLEELAAAQPPARLQAVRVTFAPGARTFWHSHPRGQALAIVAGRAWVGAADGTVEQLTAGDTARFAPGERHWHGAAADSLMAHIAMQNADDDGNAATWGEPVSDEQYQYRP